LDGGMLPSGLNLLISYEPAFGASAEIQFGSRLHDLGNVELIWSDLASLTDL